MRDPDPKRGASMTITLNRRQVVSMAGAGLELLGSRAARATAGALADWAAPDLVVLNARIYTMDSTRPKAQAFAVKDGRFVALGSTHDIKGLAGKTQTSEANEMTLVPRGIPRHKQEPRNKIVYEVLGGKPYQVEVVTIGDILHKLHGQRQKT